ARNRHRHATPISLSRGGHECARPGSLECFSSLRLPWAVTDRARRTRPTPEAAELRRAAAAQGGTAPPGTAPVEATPAEAARAGSAPGVATPVEATPGVAARAAPRPVEATPVEATPEVAPPAAPACRSPRTPRRSAAAAAPPAVRWATPAGRSAGSRS